MTFVNRFRSNHNLNESLERVILIAPNVTVDMKLKMLIMLYGNVINMTMKGLDSIMSLGIEIIDKNSILRGLGEIDRQRLDLYLTFLEV